VGRAATLAALVAVAIATAGCGGDGDGDGSPAHAEGKTLSVYVSVPRHGRDAGAGAAALAGARAALRDAGGRAGGKPVRIVPVSTTRAGDEGWDPGTVEAGADRAADDPSTIAYVGEVDQGASALSLPVTNRMGILQVSPTDSLASLTRRPPAKPRAGPERYYPDGRRSFLRLVPNDLEVAAALLDLTEGRRRVAVVSGPGIAARELASTVAKGLVQRGPSPLDQVALRDDSGAIADAVADLARERPDAIVLTGSEERAAAEFLAGLARRIPTVPVLTDGGIASLGPGGATPPDTRAVSPVLPTGAQPPSGRRVLRTLARQARASVQPEALYGYTAMETVLEAIAAGGSHRAAVARVARATGPRRTPLGTVDVRRSGDAGRPALALVRVEPRGPVLERTLP
jgi:branched-chain amino acid transport system substrate-binding protein